MNKVISTRIRTIARNKSLLSFVRSAGAWNRDWKPGPYPNTQAEREAAAKKYGLHIRDYKPYPDDGTGWGDYPMFDPVSFEGRDPFQYYDNPEHRRNFGELIHPAFEVYTGDRYNVNKKHSKKLWQQAGFFIWMVTFFTAMMFYSESHKLIKPVMDDSTQFPAPGKVHFTFERED